MTDKYQRRDNKRRHREKAKRMRGNRSVFTILRQIFKRNKFWKVGKVDL
jgi:hypothetical protein